MQDSNFLQGVRAIMFDMQLFFGGVMTSPGLLGFIGGIIISSLIAGLILSRNPRHIPLILRYSSEESFGKIVARNQHHHYDHSFAEFIKVYTRIKILFYVSFTALCLVILAILFWYRPV